jgi:hypothetical protein
MTDETMYRYINGDFVPTKAEYPNMRMNRRGQWRVFIGSGFSIEAKDSHHARQICLHIEVLFNGRLNDIISVIRNSAYQEE